MEHLRRIIAEYPFCKGLESYYIDLLTSCASSVRFETDCHLFRKGREASQFYLIQARAGVCNSGKCLRGKCEKNPHLGYELLKPTVEIIGERLEARRHRVLDLYSAQASPRG